MILLFSLCWNFFYLIALDVVVFEAEETDEELLVNVAKVGRVEHSPSLLPDGQLKQPLRHPSS